MKDNLQGGSTPKSIVINGVTYTRPYDFNTVQTIWAELAQGFRESYMGNDQEFVQRLNAEAAQRLFDMETALDDGLTWLGDVAFRMGISLEQGNTKG